MALVSNIVVGISSWASTHAYSVGNLVTNSANVYICVKPGTSAGSGGPTGTTQGVTDSTVTWNYVCHVDYTSVPSWEAAIPSILAQPVVGQVLAVGPIDISTPAFVAWLSLSGHSTTPTNTITLTAFPGYGVAGLIAPALNNALALNTSGFVIFQAPVTPAGSVNYFDITDSNVIFDGLQFQDQGSASNSTLLNTESSAGNFVLRNCIIDGYAQAGGANIVAIGGQSNIYGNLIVDRQAAANSNAAVIYSSTATNVNFINNTVVRTNADTSGAGVLVDYTGGSTYLFRNNLFIGSTYPLGGGPTAEVDHNVTSSTAAGDSIGFSQTDGGGNVLNVLYSGGPFSPVFSNQFDIGSGTEFVNAATDFRLKRGASSLKAGVADTTDVPGGLDIAGRTRVQWDAGAWAYFLPASQSNSFNVLAARATAAFSFNNAAIRQTFGVLVASAVATTQGPDLVHATNSFVLKTQGLITSATFCHTYSGAFSLDFPSDFDRAVYLNPLFGHGLAAVQIFAQGANTFDTLSAAAASNQPNPTFGLVSFDVLNISSLITQQQSLINILPLSCVAAAVPVQVLVGISNIDLGQFVRLDQVASLSASVTLNALRGNGAVNQFDRANGLVTFAYTASGIAAPTAVGVSAFLTLVSSGTATQFGRISAAITLFALGMPTLVGRYLLADSTSLNLAANSTGLLLRADVQRVANLTSNTNASEVAAFDLLTSAVTAFNSDVATLVHSFLTLSTASTAIQQDLAAGNATFAFTSASQSVQQDVATGLTIFDTLTVSGVAGQSDGTTTAVTILPLSSTAVFGGSNPTNEVATFTYVAAGLAGQGDVATAVNVFDSIIGVGVAVQQDGVTFSGTLSLLNVALVVLENKATSVDTIALSAAATGQQIDSATSANTWVVQCVGVAAITGAGGAISGFNLSCVAQMSSFTNVVGRTNLVISAAGNIVSNTNATGGPGLNYIVAAQLIQEDPTTATNALTLSCVSTAVNALVITGASTFTFGAAATAIIIPQPVHAANNLDITCVARSAQFTGAEALVELDRIVASHARLFPSPIGFVEGDDVVYWSS